MSVCVDYSADFADVIPHILILWYNFPMSENSMYEINQKIVYPSQGVGKIVDITEKKFKDNLGNKIFGLY